MHFDDLSNYSYSGGLRCYRRHAVKNVGWLSSAVSYPTGTVSPEVCVRLAGYLLPYRVHMYRGLHECPFCGKIGVVSEHAPGVGLGSFEVWVEWEDTWYAAPNLVLHYIEAHDYAPPEPFIRGILEGHAPDSLEYKIRLLEVLLEPSEQAPGGSNHFWVPWLTDEDEEEQLRAAYHERRQRR